MPWSHQRIQGASGLQKFYSKLAIKILISKFGIIFGGFIKGKLKEGFIIIEYLPI